jgi:hypothetical protein
VKPGNHEWHESPAGFQWQDWNPSNGKRGSE